MMKAFGLLARLKFLRGTALDPFGRTAERRIERRLITDYEALIEEILAGLDHDRHRLAVALASLPGADPRLWPCEAGPSRQGRKAPGGAPGRLPRAGGAAERGGVARSRQFGADRLAPSSDRV